MKNGLGKLPTIRTLRKWRKTKKITEPIVSDTSLSQGQDTPQELLKQNSQNPPINPPVKFNNRFSGDQVMKILYWLAIFTPAKEIVKLVKEEFGIPISLSTLN